jgi:TetR/AcrR family transcriptional regulator, cholesterol catabolism regulator
MARQSRVRADERRAGVLEASVEIFSRLGYRGATMNDIAAEVGLEKPSLYHYFPSKEGILVQLYENVLDESFAMAREIVEQAPNSLDAFRQLLVSRVAYTCRNRHVLKVFFEEENALPTQIRESLAVRRREFEDILKSVAAAHLSSSGIELSTPLTVYINTCLGAVNWTYKWFDPAGTLAAEQLGNDVADILIRPLLK